MRILKLHLVQPQLYSSIIGRLANTYNHIIVTQQFSAELILHIGPDAAVTD